MGKEVNIAAFRVLREGTYFGPVGTIITTRGPDEEGDCAIISENGRSYLFASEVADGDAERLPARRALILSAQHLSSGEEVEVNAIVSVVPSAPANDQGEERYTWRNEDGEQFYLGTDLRGIAWEWVDEAPAAVTTALPTYAAARKNVPVFSGVVAYFPDALIALAAVSKTGNDQHNPGQPLHWARDKSNDHVDCAMRHLIEHGQIDTDGHSHTAKAAWRLLAMLQLEIEASRENH